MNITRVTLMIMNSAEKMIRYFKTFRNPHE